MAAGSVILELAVWSGKVHLRTELVEILFGGLRDLCWGLGGKMKADLQNRTGRNG